MVLDFCAMMMAAQVLFDLGMSGFSCVAYVVVDKNEGNGKLREATKTNHLFGLCCCCAAVLLCC